MNKNASTSSDGMKRRRGWWWKISAALVVLLLVLIALLPTLVNWGLANGVIRGAIEKNVNGTAAWGALHTSWFGNQSIEHLAVTAPDGMKAIDVTATLHTSLIGLIFSSGASYDVDLAGDLESNMRDNGTLSLTDLVKPSTQPSPPPSPSGSTRSPAPTVNVNINSMRITLHDLTSNQTIVLQDVKGKAALEPGKIANLDLVGTSDASGRMGAFGIEANTSGAIDATGAFTPSAASASIAIVLRNMPVLFSKTPAVVHEFEININSSDLTKSIAVTMTGKSTVQEEQPSSLNGDITITQLFSADGALTPSFGSITGTVAGTRVPITLLQPLLAHSTAIQIERDLGRTLDVNASFSEGESKRVELQASTDMAMLNLAGTINTVDGSLDCDHLELVADVAPPLAQQLANIEMNQPVHAVANFSKFTIPGSKKDGSMNLGAIALAGEVKIEQPVRVTLPGESPRVLHLKSASMKIASEAIGTLLHATGSAQVDELTIDFDESVTNLMDDAGKVDLATLVPEGSMRVAGMTDETMTAFAPSIADLVASNKVLPATAELRTQAIDGGWTADLTLAGNKLDGLVTAQRTGDAIRVQLSNLDMRVSPALVAALQEGKAAPIVLTGPAQLHLVSDPIVLDATALRDLDLASVLMAMHGDFAEAELANVPAVNEPLRVTGFDADFTLRMEPERSLRAVGTAALKLAADNMPLASIDFDLGMADVAGVLSPTGMLTLRDISLAAVEHATGHTAGSLAAWVGETGDVQLTLDRDGDTYSSDINAALANLSGHFSASLGPQVLSLSAETSKFVLSKDALNRFLARGALATNSSSAPSGSTLLAITELPLNANVRSIRLPIGAISNEPIDPKLVELDIALAGGPVSFTDPSLGTLTSQSIAASIKADDLSKGVQIDANVVARSDRHAASATEDTPTRLQIAGTATNLLDSESRISSKGAMLDMTIDAERIPTALVDAMGSFKGMLGAALGPEVKFHANAEQFSLATGKLTTRLDADHGWMEGILKGRDGLLQLSVNNPMRAELEITPELRDRLLYKIHPILADIRTTEHPLRVLVPNASIPTNGDVSKLNARIEITVGKVELDGGSTSLLLLKLFNTSGNGTSIPGSIEPIVANIVNGVLTYDTFAVHIDKYRMAYSGTIDLNTGAVNLRTELPLEALAANIKELQGYTDNLVVPIVTRGSFGNLKTQIDPSFDFTKAALKSGIKGALGDLLGGNKNKDNDNSNGVAPKPEDQIGDVLDSILRGIGRPKNQSDGTAQNGPSRGGSRQSGK